MLDAVSVRNDSIWWSVNASNLSQSKRSQTNKQGGRGYHHTEPAHFLHSSESPPWLSERFCCDRSPDRATFSNIHEPQNRRHKWLIFLRTSCQFPLWPQETLAHWPRRGCACARAADKCDRHVRRSSGQPPRQISEIDLISSHRG